VDIPRRVSARSVPQVKGGRSFGERRSSSRERRSFEGGRAGSFVLRRERLRVTTSGGRRSGSVKRTPFTRPPRIRSWRPSKPRTALEETRGRAGNGRRRQERQRRSARDSSGGRTLRHTSSPGRRSEKRVVKRDSPRPRLHRAAPSFPVPATLVSGRVRRRAKKAFARTSTEPRGSGTRAALERASKDLARVRSLRWETAKHECSSWNGFGVQTSIGRIAGRDARGRYQAHHGYARPSPKDSLPRVWRAELRGDRTTTVRGLDSAF